MNPRRNVSQESVMPLDPQVKALLDFMATVEGKPLEEQSVEEARAQIMQLRELAGPPADVAKVEDREIPGPGGPIPIRVYTPEGSGLRPVLVYYHGGGWVVGSRDLVDVPVRALANRSGCVVVSVEYRLAPEHKFPAAPEDCYAATRWVAENAAALGVDPNRLAVGGDSAGGNLAAAVSLMARDRGGPKIAYQLLIYPVTNRDFTTRSYQENADDYLLTRNAMIWFWDHYLARPEDAWNAYAAPLLAADLSGLPPARVITAEFDPLRDEGEAYAARLIEEGVPVELRRYDGMIHGFFQMGGTVDGGNLVVVESAAALRGAIEI
jgi:acetyl esterase